MLVYIDESGDPGFKIKIGATPFFVFSMVLFKSYAHADHARKQIKSKCLEIRIPEFKFSKTSNDYKQPFFELANTLDFTVNFFVVDKSTIYCNHLKSNKDSFYNFFLKQLLGNDRGLLTSPLTVYIDGNGDKNIKRNLTSYLKREAGNRNIKSVRFADSQAESLIQLSDMLAGAAHRAFRKDQRCDNTWMRMIEDKVHNNWIFK